MRLLTAERDNARLDALACKRGLVLRTQWPDPVSKPAPIVQAPAGHNEGREAFAKGWNSCLEICKAAVGDSMRVSWPNGCDRTVVEALSFLAAHPRPAGGQERFNAEHLLQLARELHAVVRQTTVR